MLSKTIGFVGLATALVAVPAFGHHSHDVFDTAQVVTLQGSVSSFEWVFPHGWLSVNVADTQGQDVEWTLEMGSPDGLARRGWQRGTLRPGTPVTVTIHPMKDGTLGGAVLAVTFPNRVIMSDEEYLN